MTPSAFLINDFAVPLMRSCHMLVARIGILILLIGVIVLHVRHCVGAENGLDLGEPPLLRMMINSKGPLVEGGNVNIVVETRDLNDDFDRLQYADSTGPDWINANSEEKLTADGRIYTAKVALDGLRAGDLILRARAVDAKGNVSHVEGKWRVYVREEVPTAPDETPGAPPTIRIVTRFPKSLVEGGSLNVVLEGDDTDGDLAGFQYRINEQGAWVKASSRVVVDNLHGGDLTFSARALDAEGHIAELNTKWVVNARPTLQLVQVVPTSPVEGDTIEARTTPTDRDGDPVTVQYREAGSSEWNDSFTESVLYGPLTAGPLSLELRATDCLANVSDVVRHDVSVSPNVATRSEPVNFAGHSHDSPVYALAVNSTANLCASGDRTGKIYFTRGQSRDVLTGHGSIVHSLAISPNRQFLASGSADGTLRIWRCSDGQQISELNVGTRVLCVGFLPPAGSAIAAGGEDGYIRIFDAAQKTLLRQFRAHEHQVHALAVTSDGRRIISAGSDIGSADGLHAVRVWGATNFSLDREFRRHTQIVRCVICSPDDTLLASGSRDGFVHVWRLGEPTLDPVVSLKAGGDVYSIDFSPDGKAIGAGDDLGRVQFWRLSDQRRTSEHATVHAGTVTAMKFSDDGQFIFSASFDGIVKRWGK